MNLNAFMAQNALPIQNRKVRVSDRFLDEGGQPIEWELRPLTNEEDRVIRQACTKRIPVPGKRNVFLPETNFNDYILKTCVASVVYPDLHDKDLQDSYGVMGAEALLEKMLIPGEYSNLSSAVQEINGFDLEIEVENAKN
ncbi:MAG: phage portal protein [Clostridiaceae bacterium]|jgi:hypothetical protein|nr:phage portal protein [Clostridiaceae bacterium]